MEPNEELLKACCEVVSALSALRFFPFKETSTIDCIAWVVFEMCNTKEEAYWLKDEVLLAWNDWPGPRDLRALFCQKFQPKDGIVVSLERPIARRYGAEEVKRLRDLPYSEYLQTDHWRTLRLDKLREAGHRCQLCNTSTGLEVHHRSYENLGRESLADLIALCGDCHGHFHDKLKVQSA